MTALPGAARAYAVEADGACSPSPAMGRALARALAGKRVCLAHDWLVAQRGGENVLLALCDLFPEAPIYTLVHVPGRVHPRIEAHRIRTSFIQTLPFAPDRFRAYLPLFPRAAREWDVSDYDVVISTSHCVAKAVPTSARQCHVSYVHTPMRYIWDQLPNYLPNARWGRLLEPAVRAAVRPLQRWDAHTSQAPQALIANSAFVARRIGRVWQRRADVLHPPVDVDYFGRAPARPRHGFVVVSALVPYKRVDLAVRWATETKTPLTVIGDGPMRARLRAEAGETVRLCSQLSRADLRAAYAAAEGLIHCGVEDFGIVAAEAMAAGCPVVAFGRGGMVESVVGAAGGTTVPKASEAEAAGVLFYAPTVKNLDAAVRELRAGQRSGRFARGGLRARAQTFSPRAFADGMAEILIREIRAQDARAPVSQVGRSQRARDRADQHATAK